jgi:hypothetical protein
MVNLDKLKAITKELNELVNTESSKAQVYHIVLHLKLTLVNKKEPVISKSFYPPTLGKGLGIWPPEDD